MHAAALLLATVLSAEEGNRLVLALFEKDARVRKEAREALVKADDPSLAPALVECVFFAGEGGEDAALVLESLLKKKGPRSYKFWLEALAQRTDLVAKPGYAAFKGAQYARIDPRFADWLKEGVPWTIRLEEVVFGGVRKDGIPALRNPKRVAATDRAASGFTENEKVFGVVVNGVARAYPLRFLDWHEMVNDVVGGRTVTLSYCTLCGSGILFDTTPAEGETYTFGSSGLLYRSNKLMYDHQTNSLWSNLTGEPVAGPLAGKGKRLAVLPLVVSTWGEWKSRHPATEVLSFDTGHRRDYAPGAAYGSYQSNQSLMFPVPAPPPPGYAPKGLVVSATAGGQRKGYRLDDLVRQRVLNDQIGRVPVVLVTSAVDDAVRVYGRGSAPLAAKEGGTLVEEGSGTIFRVAEEGLFAEGETQPRHPRLPSHLLYWFAWHAHFGDSPLYRATPR
ncbi:MAG: DUF3179 domain-containing protein [Acidobacteria bacterium]|nr:DUF3179 domain-containing protein [Acidobacteriota bacterium]